MLHDHRHRLVVRFRRAGLAATVAVGGFGIAAVAIPTPALAAPIEYAATAAHGAGDCSSPTDACTLATALSDATTGTTINLVTSGVEGTVSTHYQGHFTIPHDVAIQPWVGVTLPILDGTTSGTVLTLDAGVHLTLASVAVEHGRAVNGAGIINENGGTIAVSNSVFTDDIATGGGGAIDNGDNGTGTLTVVESSFSGNQAVNGGAIDIGDNGNAGVSATITDSTFDSNTATGGGGAIADGSNGHGAVTVTGSTFVGNHATLNGGAIDVGDNGAAATLTLSDSTFDSNTAGARGGAIDIADNSGHGTVTLTAATFAGNTATTAGNAVRNSSTHAATTVRGDLFADTCDTAAGTLTDNGYNAALDTSCLHSGTGDKTQTVLADLLRPLAQNGGPTETRGLDIGSAALGLIPQSASALCPAVDQRGIVSATGLPCHAGAVQLAEQLPRFGTPPPLRAGIQFVPTVSVSSERPITLRASAANAANCVFSGTVLRLLAPGSCRLDATVGATANWYAGTAFRIYTIMPSASSATISAPVGVTSAGTGNSWWLSGSDGGVFAFGDAAFHGSVPQYGIHVNNVVGIAATADGAGYWLVSSDGGVFAFGDAHYEGSLPGLGVHVSNVVGIAPAPGGAGYWLVARDGAVFSFGSARYHGSVPGLGAPVDNVTAIAPTVDGSGYWLTTAQGAVYAFGAAHDSSSLPVLGVFVNDIVGITPAADGNGYWLASSDGGVFALGTARFSGSLSGHSGAAVVGLVRTLSGYRLVDATGVITDFP